MVFHPEKQSQLKQTIDAAKAKERQKIANNFRDFLKMDDKAYEELKLLIHEFQENRKEIGHAVKESGNINQFKSDINKIIYILKHMHGELEALLRIVSEEEKDLKRID